MVRLLSNLAQHKQESRLDKSLQDLARRMRGRRHPTPAAKSARVAG
jgi:hypothetical protein